MPVVITDIDRDAHIATVTVNRGEALNAINIEVACALGEAFVALTNEPDVRAIIFRGAGRAFMAGGDLGAFAEDLDNAGQMTDAMLDGLEPAIFAMRRMNAPVIAAVHGAVAGAGLSLMAACDLVIAAEGTRFMLAYNRVGATPDASGSWFLPQLLGKRKFTEMMLLDTVLDSSTALQYGLVNRVVPADQLGEAALQMAKKVASGPTQAFGIFKKLIDRAFTQPLEHQLADERAAFKACTRTQDFCDSVSAFVNKGSTTPRS
jgi:2-(1,2-epoxy-1,2-dihydrophenyl)acetyl-CoA isomerase